MKKILFLITLVLPAFLTQAQRFFYVETNNITEKPLKEGLLKASQFVVRSPLISDYIIKADAGFQTGSNIMTLQIILEDSVTFKTVFQTNEEYTFSVLNAKNAQLFLRMTLKTFIVKNINQIILCAKDDHYNTPMKLLKSKKDKT